jgi:phosphoglycolate phosphatase
VQLNQLAKYKNIVIQCHNTPNAGAIGAGFALQCCLRSLGANVTLAYGGFIEIKRPDLLKLIEALEIQISRITQLPHGTDLLITIGCQRGADNVESFDLSNETTVVTIDRHEQKVPECDNFIIRPNVSSCATIVYDLLKQEGFETDIRIQSALYYGLFCDTNELSELHHPLDRDLAEIKHDVQLIRKLKNSQITISELTLINDALKNREVVGGISLFRAEPCEVDVLNFISNIAQKIDCIDCCLAYCIQPCGINFSVRSTTREIMANELASFLCKNAGNSSGTLEKAEGFTDFKKIAEATTENYLSKQILEYVIYYDLIYANNHNVDFGAMNLYRKPPAMIGFAKSTDIFPANTEVLINAPTGNVSTVACRDTYFMIGVQGEVYPIKKSVFEANYSALDSPYCLQTEYVPTVVNKLTKDEYEISPFARVCMARYSKAVRAMKLERPTKVFTSWDLEKYYIGEIGDWLVANEGNFNDCYVVRDDIFAKSYTWAKFGSKRV